MKSVLTSVLPRRCVQIASGEKFFDIRKTCPELKTPFKCYIYCSGGGYQTPKRQRQNGQFWIGEPINDVSPGRYYGNGKVVGEYICDAILCRTVNNFIIQEDAEKALEGSCMTQTELYRYLGWIEGISRYEQKRLEFFAWHISNLKIYNIPKELDEFHAPCDRTCNGICTLGCCRIINRPPISWFYVEELK